MKKILLALGLLAAVASTAWAQTTGTNTVSRNGYYFNATTGNKTDVDGNALTSEADRDRDYSTVRSLLPSITSLAPGASRTSTAATALGEFTSLLIMVRWNTVAAADSDSVAFGLNFVGKVSTDVNDGYDFAVSSPSDSAFLLRADTTVATLGISSAAGVLVPCPTVVILSRGKATITGAAGGATPTLVPLGNPFIYDLYPQVTTNMLSTRSRPYRVPPSRIVWSDGRNGVCFMLTSPNGQPFKFSHLMCTLQNLNRIQTYTNISVDVWPKVN